MHKFIFIAFIVVFIPFSRILARQNSDSIPVESKEAFTVGFLQGGGSLVGVDMEYLIYKRFGLQLGIGVIGYGAGINFHTRKDIRSSFLSLQYWHQGQGPSFTQATLGPTYNFRLKKLLSFQIGLGFYVEEGFAYPELRTTIVSQYVMLLYSIGLYFTN
jgi:hypothetical protein